MENPKTMLDDLSWSFTEIFDDRAQFEAELAERNSLEESDLETIVFPEQQISILFLLKEDLEDMDDDDEDEDEEDEDDGEEERQILLKTENPNGFTLGELMYLIHTRVVENFEENIDLSVQDACFFEGLTYLSVDENDGSKIYHMTLGS
jgi:hypothetical protein